MTEIENIYVPNILCEIDDKYKPAKYNVKIMIIGDDSYVKEVSFTKDHNEKKLLLRFSEDVQSFLS